MLNRVKWVGGLGTGDWTHVAHDRPVAAAAKQREVGCWTGDWSHVAHDRPVAAASKHDNDILVAVQ